MATRILAPGGAPTHPKSARNALSTIAAQAESKGFRLHHCVPLTGTARETWMIQRGSCLRFFDSVESLQKAVAEATEYRRARPEVAAVEARLRAALDEVNGEVSHD